MTRFVPTIVLGCSMSLGLVGCSTMERDNGGLSFAQELGFSKGRSTRSFDIEAPDPAKHTSEFEVSAPKSADVAVQIETFNGYELHVLDSLRRENADCHMEDERRSCVVQFPVLEAQRPGRWTVIVTKVSEPPAEVAVRVKFAPFRS